MINVYNISRYTSPRDAEQTRVTAQVQIENPLREHTIWFDIPNAYSDLICDSGTPWLALILPCAFLEKQDIFIERPVDPQLLANASSILKIWGSWFSSASPIRILTETERTPNRPPNQGKLTFFSGGIDSYFTLLRAIQINQSRVAAQKIHIANIWGLDIPLSSESGFAVARDIAKAAAQNYDVSFIEVATNLRDIKGFSVYEFGSHWYADLSHGAALASTGLLLSEGIGNISIASTFPYGHLIPWGSHPLTDQLFSSSIASISHDGADSNRVEKTKYVIQDNFAVKNLRVCWGSTGNCSRCSKCLRTMATLDILGARSLATSFDWSQYQPERIANIYLESKQDEIFFDEIVDAAAEFNRKDIERAALDCLSSSRVKRALKLPERIKALSEKLPSMPLLWRCADSTTRLHRKLTGR